MSSSTVTIIIVLILMYLVYYYYVRPMIEEKAVVVPDAKPPVNPCAAYALGDTNLPDACLKNIWAGSGCINAETVNIPEYNAWWKTQTHQAVKDDMTKWSKFTDTLRRERCYGTDKTKWPA